MTTRTVTGHFKLRPYQNPALPPVGPGTPPIFNYQIDELVYALSLYDQQDEALGSGEAGEDWTGLFRAPLLGEDSVGTNFGLSSQEIAFLNAQAGAILFQKAGKDLVEVRYFNQKKDLQAAWLKLKEAYNQKGGKPCH